MISHPVHNLRSKRRGDTLAAEEFNRLVSAVQGALRTRMPRGFVSNDFSMPRHQPRLQVQAFPGPVYMALSYAPNRYAVIGLTGPTQHGCISGTPDS